MAQKLKVSPIKAVTKGEVRRLRTEGFIPISLQHRGEATQHLQTATKPMEEVLRLYGEASMIELVDTAGAEQQALIHEVQRDAVTHRVIQVTLQRVVRGEPIKVQIPLVFHGEPAAVHEKTAMVQHLVEHLEIRCLPRNLPDHITVDISHMTFGDTVRISDLPATDKYEILSPADTALVALTSLQARMTEERSEAAPVVSAVQETAPAE